MIVQSLKKHFPARAPEWFAAFTLLAWGLYLLLHPGMFEDPRQQVWLGMGVPGLDLAQSQSVWGVAALMVGMVRACALFINGVYTRTPAIRLFTAFISAYVWTQVLYGLLSTDIPNTGIIMYGSALIVDLYSAYNAAMDATFAEKQRRDMKSGRRNGFGTSFT